MFLRFLSTHTTTAGTLLKAGFRKNIPSLFWGSVRLCHGSSVGKQAKGTNVKSGHSDRASEEQLLRMEEALKETIPKFFVSAHDFSLYTYGVVFEDNIRNVRTTGLPAYMRQLSMVRLLAHVRYAHVKMNILKVYSDPVEAAVKVRWRVDALSGLRIVILLWKFNILKYRDFLNKKSDFTDGFSIFYVNSDGKIWKHVVDKMVPDEDRAVVDTEKDALAAKLSAALIVGWGGVQAVSDML
ncbi:uncharacterized protein C6orf136 homolog [Varroa destructor]|uniref:Uncharacterized protein n=1 Tax=Varroa destructor TaxID=109461 RepID=A0A7M7IXR5_VARDE|nr:uncharacterized protein C6orf136 homolog [Varroa destructor]